MQHAKRASSSSTCVAANFFGRGFEQTDKVFQGDCSRPEGQIKAMTMLKKKLDANQFNLKDQVVAINRVTKVVKGGKNMSFAALVVVGDAASGVVGYGSGKAKEVPQAIRKGIESAKKNLFRINLTETTIPHQVLGRYGSGQVLLKPAPEGTGVIAGGAVRAVMTSAGVQNVLTKSLGTANPHNVIKATFDALVQLRDRGEVATMRGKSVEEL
jgi:small subunit ribosomal protein S5